VVRRGTAIQLPRARLSPPAASTSLRSTPTRTDASFAYRNGANIWPTGDMSGLCSFLAKFWFDGLARGTSGLLRQDASAKSWAEIEQLWEESRSPRSYVSARKWPKHRYAFSMDQCQIVPDKCAMKKST
jgi:hypothetical protein